MLSTLAGGPAVRYAVLVFPPLSFQRVRLFPARNRAPKQAYQVSAQSASWARDRPTRSSSRATLLLVAGLRVGVMGLPPVSSCSG